MPLRLRLFLRLLGFRLHALLVAPLRWNEQRINKKRQHQLALATAPADAIGQAIGHIGQLLLKQSELTTAQHAETMSAFKTWLEMFRTAEVPRTTASDDKDEYSAEMQSILEREGVDAANPAAVMAWLDQSGLDQTLD